uniref:substrate-binding domain-containing protein n=1 Tax=Demequina sp. TaxID=2050685 RepID=UPI0025C12103
HQRIATVTLPPSLDHSQSDFLDGAAAKDLMAGLPASVPQRVPRARLEAFASVGLTPSQIAVCPIVTREHAYEAGKKLLSLPPAERPTAIVCQADVYAWGVWDAARDLGMRVPQDVSITGFDGLTEGVFAALDLTSVVQDGTEKGRLIARWVTLACEGPDAPPPFDLPLSVRWGTSAGPAPQS